MVTNNTEVLPVPKDLEMRYFGKKRERSHYIRPVTHSDGDKRWVTWDRTGLLPSDMAGRAYYESKGFKLDPPQGTEGAKVDDAEKTQLKAQVAELQAKLAVQNQLETQLAELKEQVKSVVTAQKKLRKRRKAKSSGGTEGQVIEGG